ncbi:hypothetical protein BDV25DRAFT_168610 [Aspergillus avenaceus]|uniref:Zn(2)-C6 fungal-type domain-containing protein n=1 Tax=Aspergillus avenaceus TaxID=36643 RepID=A0A5N6U4R1_ASPAV|nr:hypothetical protein BDV25DRAFT_168610 [Aspergillus avenaceus]
MASIPSKAHQACGPCKKHKRKCDKHLPACGLCLRTGRLCDYDESPKPPPTATEFAALQSKLTELESRMSGSLEGSLSAPSLGSDATRLTWSPQAQSTDRFPSALFLDIDCYKWAGMRLPMPGANIPIEVVTILNEGDSIIETCATYFSTIHRWMPIVSKKRLDLGIPFGGGGPDLALLFLAMKLTITCVLSSETASEDSLYMTTKGFLATLETTGVVSFRCLQALTLVALYEYSHSIYPAAWMTVGACSRYADMLGLSPSGRALNHISPCTTWTEAEERRRVWWAIFILDRVISLGSRRRFSFPGPANTDPLPVNDFAWNEGDVTRAVQCPATTPFSLLESPFARLCHAAICISQVVECKRLSQQMHTEYISGVITLSDNLCALSVALNEMQSPSQQVDEYLDLLGPRCLILSAIYMLLDDHCCPEKLQDGPGYNISDAAKTPEEQLLQVNAMLIVQDISNQLHRVTLQIIAILENDWQDQGLLGQITPFVLDALYCTMATFRWVLSEGGNETIQSRLGDVKRCMQNLGDRWHLAQEYLALEQVHERAS